MSPALTDICNHSLVFANQMKTKPKPGSNFAAEIQHSRPKMTRVYISNGRCQLPVKHPTTLPPELDPRRVLIHIASLLQVILRWNI